ncbi:MAG: hypothetical protein Q9220_003158 [cf. Caloplaca sp. 1 TL-2023]
MGSLRFSEYAESPALVIPPPSVHSFYPSACSHSIPHLQPVKAAVNPDPLRLSLGTSNTGKPLTPSHPAQKRAREESPSRRDALRHKVSKKSFEHDPACDLSETSQRYSPLIKRLGRISPEFLDEETSTSGDSISYHQQHSRSLPLSQVVSKDDTIIIDDDRMDTEIASDAQISNIHGTQREGCKEDTFLPPLAQTDSGEIASVTAEEPDANALQTAVLDPTDRNQAVDMDMAMDGD